MVMVLGLGLSGFLGGASAKCLPSSNPKAVAEPGDYEAGTPCEHYDGDTCCADASLILNVTSSVNCVARSQSCLEQLGMLACLSCSPNADDFAAESGKTAFPLSVCKELGDRIMFACKNDEFSIVEEEGGEPECKIAKDYAERDAQKLFDGAFKGMFEFSTEENASGCFNAAVTTSSSAAVLVVGLAALLL